VEKLTADRARLIALWSQGFVAPIGGATPGSVQRMGFARRRDLVHTMLRHLGAVQLDTISVLARSHELIAYSRFGAIGRDVIEDAYWHSGRSFEYWSHAACILPMESWPLFAFRRRYYQRRGIRWHDVTQSAIAPVLARLDEGPLSTADIGGAKKGGEWWDWSESKIAIEWLLDIGTVVVQRREGWRRVYDLAERCVPADLLATDLDDDQCVAGVVAEGARSLGVGTEGDIADVHRVKVADVRANAADVGLVEVRVDGWKGAAWATPQALEWIGTAPRATSRTTMLSPFDSLVWHRPRAERIFGMAHRLEAYTPAHKRVHGYFAMPVLHQGRLVARVDPKREGSTLLAKRVTFEEAEITRAGQVRSSAVAGVASALREAARWVGVDEVVVSEAVPSSALSALRRELRSGR
jgi:uncharacterized protein YcaQ